MIVGFSCCLPEEERKQIEELVGERKEKGDRIERMTVQKQKKY